MADINPPVNTLPAVTFALTDTVVPVSDVAFTLAPPSTLPAVMLPVEDINPLVNILPPVILPVTLTTLPVIEGVAPCSTVVPPAGLVMIIAVALAEI